MDDAADVNKVVAAIFAASMCSAKENKHANYLTEYEAFLSLLEARDGLPERLPASLAVGGLKLGEFKPAEEGSGSNPGTTGRILNVALGQQRSDGIILFASEN